MKHLMYLVICLFFTVPVWGQTDSTLVQNNSTIAQIKALLDKQAEVGRFKVYRTNNTYNSLRLDTATGAVSALQIGMNKESDRMAYLISGRVISDDDELIIGRFELYPTNNNYNFILLDTILGYAYQVQWSTKEKERGSWLIW